MGTRFKFKYVFASVFAIIITNAHTRTLHYGAASVELTDTKYTSPALHIKINDNETVYGAMYNSLPAPDKTIHIKYNNTEYWVGPYCSAGTYLPDGRATCSDCGYGYYCTGGNSRSVCAGGIIGCNTKNRSSDVSSSLVNRILTLDQVNSYVPVTDASDWELIVKGGYTSMTCGEFNHDLANTTGYGERGSIGPGTYLFTIRADGGTCPGRTDPASGAEGAYNAFIAVFNKTISYNILRGCNAEYIYLDTNSPQFKTWNIRLPEGAGYAYCDNYFWVNITSMNGLILGSNIYKLK